MRKDPEHEALRRVSARIGADPGLVQAAGGNTSIKDGNALWIKASGLWLRDALARDIMVPVALDRVLDAVRREDAAAERPQEFVIAAENPGGLRPSIETTMHAMLSARVVLHVHCVETIALAVRQDAAAAVASRLAGLPHAFVPYARPGLPLTRAIAARAHPDTRVLVLGNHGLTVAAETVAAADALLADVRSRLAAAPRATPAADLAALAALVEGSGYGLPPDPAVHGVAIDPISWAYAAGGSLYPDHVVFLGPGLPALAQGRRLIEFERDLSATGSRLPPAVAIPGKGVVVRTEASESALAMLRCITDVLARIPAGVALRYLTAAEVAELSDWDAEKYRQILDQAAGGGGAR